MSSPTLALRDSTTMLRRNLLHARRYPSLTLNLLLTLSCCCSSSSTSSATR